jgi:hypothetical protein
MNYALLFAGCAGLLLGSSPANRPAALLCWLGAQGREHRLGEVIRLNQGVTLKVLRAAARTSERLAPEVGDQAATVAFELQFLAAPPAPNEAYPIFSNGPSEDPAKSDIVLLAGEERIPPVAVVSFSADSVDKPAVGRITAMPLSRTTGKRVGFLMLKEGSTTVGFGFVSTAELLALARKLLVTFQIGEQRYSLVINVGN